MQFSDSFTIVIRNDYCIAKLQPVAGATRCTDGVKYGMEEWTQVHSSMPNFTPIGAKIRA